MHLSFSNYVGDYDSANGFTFNNTTTRSELYLKPQPISVKFIYSSLSDFTQI